MRNDTGILAIIPARYGSKRLPGKNIIDLDSKPLIAWTIESGLRSSMIEKVIVSTDSKNIADLSREYGAEVPFIRPPELSGDSVPTVDVVLHAVEHFRQKGTTYHTIIVLQPTSPLRMTIDIDNAIDVFRSKSAKAVISVCEAEYPPVWANTLPDTRSLDGFIPKEYRQKRSQELPRYYRLNGAVFIVNHDVLLKEKTLYPDTGTFASIMPTERSIDIDTIHDLNVARTIMMIAKKEQRA